MRTPGFSLPGHLVPGDPRAGGRKGLWPLRPPSASSCGHSIKVQGILQPSVFEPCFLSCQSWGLDLPFAGRFLL